jgi:hypothetical protein
LALHIPLAMAIRNTGDDSHKSASRTRVLNQKQSKYGCQTCKYDK